MTDPQAVKVAAFVVQALDLEDDPIALANEVGSLKRDVTAGISTLELDSTVGRIPLLIYDYQLTQSDLNGVTGQRQFEQDLQTLERAAVAETPGPRILAHAIAGDEAFILATTPEVHRVLTGGVSDESKEAVAPDARPVEEQSAARTDAANELLSIFRDGDAAARRWLEAIQRIDRNGDVDDEFLEFNQAEAALALYVLDERSIQHLLRALNLLVHAAKGNAGENRGPASESSGP